MKKFLLSAALIAASIMPAFAQEPAPVIKELRAIVADASTGFAAHTGAEDSKDAASGSTFYKPAKEPQASICQQFVLEKAATKHRTYVLRYGVKDLDAMMLRILMIMAQKYIDEMNTMVKSGEYTGRDYNKEDGTSVTEINDLKGNHILDYQSTKDQQMILVYGTAGH